MENCFSYAIYGITGAPERTGFTYAQHLLPLVVECDLKDATIVMKVDRVGPYHAAIVSKRDKNGLPTMVMHREKVGVEVKEVSLSTMTSSHEGGEIKYYKAKNM